ncbi:complement factor H-like isoform X2 [Mercenaria mercenaria]|uniref:complement factor H-like isoform X2 n=1 Tax=Mercenaria mercenaria TaxID=6596 RepID=UPI00234EF6D0|nr:complement factor H-like isoform X2 [Mercenaria mercenaria]
MTRTKGLHCFLFFILELTLHINANRCIIPRGGQYRRSVFRPQYGSNTNKYPPGRRISHGTKIVITCKKDIYHDLATQFSFSKCQNGKWDPALPQCKVQRRCRAPKAIQHATASEPLTPNITFPHGTTVTYTCDVGKMATGSNTVVCDNGEWSASNFTCLDGRGCLIPSGAQYRRSEFRSKAGSSTGNYPAGSMIGSGSTIVAICKKDKYGDVITKWISSKCQSGEWIPALPGCKVYSRCRAPPSIEHAIASERITPYITFPHGTTVTYTCDVGKMATGSDTVICTDGQWSNTNFQCEDNPDYMPGTTTVISTTTKRRRCSQLTVGNGKISVRDTAYDTYDVTCNAGFRLKSTKTNTYICRGGTWIDEEPKCVRALHQCEISDTMRRGSEIKSKATGEIINVMFVHHWTQVVQTCKVKLRNAKSRTARCVNGRWRPTLMTCPDISENRQRNSDIDFDNNAPDETTKQTPATTSCMSQTTSDETTTGEMVSQTITEDLSTFIMTSVNTATSTETILLTSTEDQEAFDMTSSNQTTTVTTPQMTISTSSEDKATSGMTSSTKATTVTTAQVTSSTSHERQSTPGMTSSTQKTTVTKGQATNSTSSNGKATSGMTSSTIETTVTTGQAKSLTSSEHQATSGMTSTTETNYVITAQMPGYGLHFS